jgi:AcrR family transcriptional regulator
MGDQSPTKLEVLSLMRITRAAQDRVREQLLHTAAAHFARDGFDRANINDIAVEAGFAKGTVYNYFSSKAELFGAVLEVACERAVDLYTASTHGESTRSSLEALAAADVEVLREQEPFMKVLVREAMSFRPETYSTVVSHLGPFLLAIEQVLDRGVAQGQVRDDRPVEQLAVLFVGILSMLYVQHWGSGGVWPGLDELPALAVNVFLDGAAPSPHERAP